MKLQTYQILNLIYLVVLTELLTYLLIMLIVLFVFSTRNDNGRHKLDECNNCNYNLVRERYFL